jgi:hypothetical protein
MIPFRRAGARTRTLSLGHLDKTVSKVEEFTLLANSPNTCYNWFDTSRLREVTCIVPLTLELAQTVAIGAFNPFLISPDWLVKYKVCPDAVVDLRLVAIGGGASFRLGRVLWEVDNQRLVVSSSEPGLDCGEMVSRVLTLLPHTPVRAVGHNFHFSAARDQWGDRPSPALGGKGLEDFDSIKQVRWVGLFQRDEVRIEVTLAYEADAVAVLFNHHRNMDLEQTRRAETANDQIAQAMAAANRFGCDSRASCELLRTLFDVEMPDV